MTMSERRGGEIWDCIVVGGGAAGLSAALVLGRARRRTLLIDAGEQANLPAHGIGGLLGHDGRPPRELYELGRKELESYPAVELRQDRVVRLAAADEGGEQEANATFSFELASGDSGMSRRIILASGMTYRPPQVPGLAELWGDSVFHCPFCHGWEVRDRPLAMLGQGERAVHGAGMIRGWSDDVVLLTNGPSDLDADQQAKLAAMDVPVDERPLAELLARDGRLAAIRFEDGTDLAREGLMVATTLRREDRLAEQLGLETADYGEMSKGAIKVDTAQRTSLDGVYAAGDITGGSQNAASAIASGSMAAAQAVASLNLG
jgi:thioredoxin reductase